MSGSFETLISTPRRFVSRPGQDFIDQFKAHIAARGNSKTFPGLCWTKPDPDDPPDILDRFDINLKAHEDACHSPCAVCSPKYGKFLYEGYLVWFAKDGLVRIIGPECGADYFKSGVFRRAVKKLDDDARLAWLLDHLPIRLSQIPQMKIAANRLVDAAGELDRLKSVISKDIPKTEATLGSMAGSGAGLRITIVMKRDKDSVGPSGIRGTSVDTREEEFGPLAGRPLFQKRVKHTKEAIAIAEAVSAFPELASDDEILDYMADAPPGQTDLAWLEWNWGTLARLADRHRRAANTIADARHFFDTSNISRLNDWGDHEANETPVAVEVIKGATYQIRQGRNEQTFIKPDMDKLKNTGDWPTAY